MKNSVKGKFCAGQLLNDFFHYIEYEGKKIFLKKLKPEFRSTHQLFQKREEEENLFSEDSSRKGETHNEDPISEV